MCSFHTFFVSLSLSLVFSHFIHLANYFYICWPFVLIHFWVCRSRCANTARLSSARLTSTKHTMILFKVFERVQHTFLYWKCSFQICFFISCHFSFSFFFCSLPLILSTQTQSGFNAKYWRRRGILPIATLFDYRKRCHQSWWLVEKPSQSLKYQCGQLKFQVNIVTSWFFSLYSVFIPSQCDNAVRGNSKWKEWHI